MTPSWSQDRKWIYFVSNRTGNNQVWKMPAAGDSVPEEPVQVTRNGGSHPTESLDGKLLYYFKEYAMWQVPVIGGKETKVFEPIDAGSFFAVADRGIYFIPRGEAAVRFFDFRSKSIHPVATLGPSRFADLFVSRDGRTILFAQLDSSVSDLMLVENFR
jgi:dipeptidyl aminopeptidase/acylaminoacyl peptidase